MKRSFGHIRIPLQRIHLELTNVCEYNCAFCPKALMTRKYGYMDENLAKRLMDEIAEYGLAEKITLHVMGEPTLHPRFFEILGYAAKIGLPVGLTTHGGTLGGAVGRRLVEYPLHQVDVSLQTPDPESFTLRRARNITFDQYKDNMLEFFGAYHRAHPETIFKFRFLNTAFRKKSIEKKSGPVRVISSAAELHDVFARWVGLVYAAAGWSDHLRDAAIRGLSGLRTHQWNVVEVLPNVFFETYILADWGHAFDGGRVHKAVYGYCDGIREHFAVLHNGNVTLCCIDFDGKTAVGNVRERSLKEVLSGEPLGRIVRGMRRFKLVHPYCRHCLGSPTALGWMLKPVGTLLAMNLLRPYFYRQVRVYPPGMTERQSG